MLLLGLNNSNILLHYYFEGCIEIANPEGSIFHPKGRSPEGWRMDARDWQYQCIPRNDRAIVFLHSLLNKHILGKSSKCLVFLIFCNISSKNLWKFRQTVSFSTKKSLNLKNSVNLTKFWKLAMVFLPREVALIFGN